MVRRHNDRTRACETVVLSILSTLSTVIVSASDEFQTVTIGTQEWMMKNLSVDTFPNGDVIPEAKTATQWTAAYKNEAGAWSYYDNNAANGDKYGKLYNWYAVADPRGLCPSGWHVPSDGEWRTLIRNLGGMSEAFVKLKAPRGFAALPAGARDFKTTTFNHIGNITFWWSATKNDKWNAWYHAMHFGYSQVGRDNGGMNAGHSVRCVRSE